MCWGPCVKSSDDLKGKRKNSQRLLFPRDIDTSDVTLGTCVAALMLIMKILASEDTEGPKSFFGNIKLLNQCSLKSTNFYAFMLRHFESQLSVTCCSEDPVQGGDILL